MLKITSFLCLCALGLSYASPVFPSLEPGLRYQHVQDSNGKLHLSDTWLTTDSLIESDRFNPVQSNVYHLFTRDNPAISQPLLVNNVAILRNSNFSGGRRTIILIHGWMDSASSDFTNVLVPAFLAAEDLNVIVVDWSAGASSINYRAVIRNTISSGEAVADFIRFLNLETASSPVQYHIVGHGFGGHQAGIVGRNLEGQVSYITALDPALIGWVNNVERFAPYDGLYTEVVHTNYGINGYLADLGQVDFYPNGGLSMPGCDTNACDHAMSYYYLAESIVSGGFTGRPCLNYLMAIVSTCDLLTGSLPMGGLRPKLGSTGVYLLETNEVAPYSQG